jgi:hypothetical protein
MDAKSAARFKHAELAIENLSAALTVAKEASQADEFLSLRTSAVHIRHQPQTSPQPPAAKALPPHPPPRRAGERAGVDNIARARELLAVKDREDKRSRLLCTGQQSIRERAA